MEYVLEYHIDSVKPWTVLARQVGADYWTQVAPWYTRKATAYKQLLKMRGEVE